MLENVALVREYGARSAQEEPIIRASGLTFAYPGSKEPNRRHQRPGERPDPQLAAAGAEAALGEAGKAAGVFRGPGLRRPGETG